MRAIVRDRYRISLLFAAWCAIVALRAIFTRPLESLWFLGIAAAFSCAFTCGYIYRGIKEYRGRL